MAAVSEKRLTNAGPPVVEDGVELSQEDVSQDLNSRE